MARLVSISGTPNIEQSPDMRLCPSAAASYEKIYKKLSPIISTWVINSAYRDLNNPADINSKYRQGRFSWHHSGRAVDISTKSLTNDQLTIIVKSFRAAGWQYQPEPDFNLMHFELEHDSSSVQEEAMALQGILQAPSVFNTASLSPDSGMTVPTTTPEHQKDAGEDIVDPKATSAVLDQSTDPGLPEYAYVPGATKIGDVWLYVPPTQITITEYNSINIIPSIRTIGNPKIGTGQQELRIEMELFFTDVDDFNRALRPIIAQMRRTPFIPLENDFIRKLLTVEPSAAATLRADIYEEAVSRLNNVISTIKLDIPDDTEFIQLTDKMPYVGPGAKGTLGTLGISSIPVDLTINELSRKSIAEKAERKKRDHGLLGLIEPNFSNPQPVEEAAGVAYGLPFADSPIPVVLHSIQLHTVDGFPCAIQCSLQLNLFNYRPYSQDFSFVKTEEDAIHQIHFNKFMRSPAASNATRVGVPNKEARKTLNCSESIPFKKYYQGQLSEYNVEGIWGYEGPYAGGNWIPKTYPELPYSPNRFDLPSMPEASAAGFQKLSITGKVTAITIGAMLDEFKLRLEHTRKMIALLKHDPDENDVLFNLFTSIKRNWNFFIHYFSTLSTELAHVLSKSPLSLIEASIPGFLKTDNDQIQVWDLNRQEYVTFDEYIDSLVKDGGDKEKLQELLDAFLLIVRKFSSGDLFKTNERTLDFAQEGVVIQNVAAGLENKLIPIPIISYNVPTYQHIGGSDFVCTINFTTNSLSFLKDLRTLSIMTQYTRKAAYAQAAIPDISEKARRSLIYQNSSFTLNTSPDGINLLQALGINKVMIGDVIYQTVKGNPGTYSATITLYQADVDLLEKEVLISRTGASAENIKRALAWLTVTSQNTDMLNTKEPERASIVKVIDGDTLLVALSPEHTEKIRLLGIDTAETVKYLDYAGGVKFGAQTGGIEATNFVKSLLKPGQLILLRSDPYQPDKDHLDRLLRYVEFSTSIIRTDNVQDLGVELITHGHSRFDAQWPIYKYFEYSALDQRTFKRSAGDVPANKSLIQVEKQLQIQKDWNQLRNLISKNRVVRSDITEAQSAALLDTDTSLWKGVTSVFDMDRARRYEDALRATGELPHQISLNRVNLSLLSFEIYQKLKYLLLTPEALNVLNTETVTIDGQQYGIHKKLASNPENPVSRGTYRDLALPSFNNQLLGTLDTPVDFYFYRNPSVDPGVTSAIAKDLASKRSYLHHLENTNKVIHGQATTRNRSEKLFNIFQLMLRAQDRTQKRSTRKSLNAKIAHLTDELAQRDRMNLLTSSVPKDFYDRAINEIKSNINSIDSDLSTLTQAEQLPLDENLARISTANVEAAKDILEQARAELEGIREGLGGDASAEAAMSYVYGTFTREALLETAGTVEEAAKLLNSSIKTINHKIGGLRKNDRMFHMSRAFPTFALYFVEEDNPEWLFFNDVYGYDCINSIDIISSRESASDTAIVKLANLTGVLTSSVGKFARENLLYDSTDREQTLTSFFLQPGTRIILKMGFENNPDDMDILFDGAITTVKPGDEVEIIAQSWGAQLNQPIGVRKPLHYSWKNYTNSYGHVISAILNHAGGLGQFGGKSLFNTNISRPDQLRRGFWTHALIQPFINMSRTNGLSAVANYLTKNTVDDNIYLRYAHSVYFHKFSKNTDWSEFNIRSYRDAEKKSNYKDFKFSWYINQQTAWDAIQEVLIYHPDYIVKTLPYNADSLGKVRTTLYVGPWDGYYKYTDRFNDEVNAIIDGKVEEQKDLQLQLFKLEFPHLFGGRQLWHSHSNAPSTLDETIAYYLGENPQESTFGTIVNRLGERIASPFQTFMNLLPFIESAPGHPLSFLFPNIMDKRRFRNKLKAINNDYLTSTVLENNPEDYAGIPGYEKVVTDHIVTSKNHIIANNIRADANNIYNHIILRFPNSPTDEVHDKAQKKWKYAEFIADDGIPPEYRRSTVSFQKNVNKTWKDRLLLVADEQAKKYGGEIHSQIPSYFSVGNNLLANSLRYMYTGELIVTLSPEIRTWDKVYIYDDVTQMTGLIGVRQVHHHFDSTQGAWTAITPDLIVHPRNYNHIFEDKYMVNTMGMWMKNFFPMIEPDSKVSAADMLDAIAGKNPWYSNRATPWGLKNRRGISSATQSVGATAGLLLGAPGGVGGALAGLTFGNIAGTFYGFKWADKMWTAGVGRLFQQQMVQLVGLWYKGKPFYAGIEGFRRENILVHLGEKVESFELFGAMATRYGKMLVPSSSTFNIPEIR